MHTEPSDELRLELRCLLVRLELRCLLATNGLQG